MRTSRIVVIDEDEGDALPILEALGRLGLGAIWVKGDDVKHLPAAPCEGIRCVFLDLQLISTREARNFVPNAVDVLERVVRVDPKVTGIVVWSKHDADVGLLKDELDKRSIAPAYVKQIESKASIRDNKDLAGILRQLEEITDSHPGLGLLGGWEQLVHNATTETTQRLGHLSQDDSDVLKVLARVSLGAAEETVNNPTEALEALSIGLTAVLADSIGALASESKVFGDKVEKGFLTAVLANPSLAAKQTAQLNQVLLTTPSYRSAPGNVYLWSTWPRHARLLANEIYVRPNVREAIAAKALSCFVEITPACDFAQGKSMGARLLEGLLIPAECGIDNLSHLDVPRTNLQFARATPFFWIDHPLVTGSYRVVVNARSMLSVSGEDIDKRIPLFRLRSSIIADLRAWFASHAARPGFVSV